MQLQPLCLPLQALKVLHNSTEFLPHVIFLCPPPVEANYNIITAADLENGKPCQNIELAVSRPFSTGIEPQLIPLFRPKNNCTVAMLVGEISIVTVSFQVPWGWWAELQVSFQPRLYYWLVG